MKNQRKYTGCIEAADQIPRDSVAYSEASELRQECRKLLAQTQLEQAKSLQQKNDLEGAIALAGSAMTFFPEAQMLVEELAVRLLEHGRQIYQEGRSFRYLNDASFPVLAIPVNSARYNEAQSLVRQWKAEAETNKRLLQVAQDALLQEDVATAKQSLAKLTKQVFWQSQAASTWEQVTALELWQLAKNFAAAQEWQNVLDIAIQLPDAPPWSARKSLLMNQAQAHLRFQKICRMVTFGAVPQCFSPLNTQR
jgi:tetratricopeptide (TPR) repeat protein